MRFILIVFEVNEPWFCAFQFKKQQQAVSFSNVNDACVAFAYVVRGVESDQRCVQGLNGCMIGWNSLNAYAYANQAWSCEHFYYNSVVRGACGRYCEQRQLAVYTPIKTAMRSIETNSSRWFDWSDQITNSIQAVDQNNLKGSIWTRPRLHTSQK